jgi:predicted amidohydrolase YtcJ
MVAGVAPVAAQQPQLGPIARIFVGKIRTMNSNDRVAQAVAVDGRGLIVAIGTEKEILAAAAGITPAPEVIRLENGQTLLPGFLDAHLHIVSLLIAHSGLAKLVGPCLPDPYKAGNSPGCQNYIGATFTKLRKDLPPGDKAFLFGVNLDPSRQPYDETTTSVQFKLKPAYYIEKDLTSVRPVLLIDQSGHFGYANHAAFRALREVSSPVCGEVSDTCPPFPPDLGPGGEWNLTKEGCEPVVEGTACDYTGLLTEVGSYPPFFVAVGDRALQVFKFDPKKYILGIPKGVIGTQDAFRKAGLTTVTSMAMSSGEVTATMALADLKGWGTRIMSIVDPVVAAAPPVNSNPILPACDPRTTPTCKLPMNLGVSAVKVIVDGSTQGCTAALQAPVNYQKDSECTEPEGRLNYASWEDVRKDLWPFWQKGTWRFEAHANGNRAIDMVLHTYASMQSEKRNDHTATVIHATVGDVAVWGDARNLRNGTYKGKPVPKIDLRFTHLIGHVAYWGAVLERQLGKASAANLDPTVLDRENGIPFTLHSDATVSLPVPLWFIRQAVTRETWTYPGLEQKSMHVVGSKQRISVLEALRAVTIRTAEEKELDRWLGSIEVGKVADFVVLSADPVLFESDPTKISDIQVIDTYLGGERTKPLIP